MSGSSTQESVSGLVLLQGCFSSGESPRHSAQCVQFVCNRRYRQKYPGDRHSRPAIPEVASRIVDKRGRDGGAKCRVLRNVRSADDIDLSRHRGRGMGRSRRRQVRPATPSVGCWVVLLHHAQGRLASAWVTSDGIARPKAELTLRNRLPVGIGARTVHLSVVGSYSSTVCNPGAPAFS